MKKGTQLGPRRGQAAAVVPPRPQAAGPVLRVVVIRDGRYVARRPPPGRGLAG